MIGEKYNCSYQQATFDIGRYMDNLKHQGLRKRLVEELQTLGIADKHVLNAIGKVPRHLFMDSAFLSFAYQNKAFPIGAGQTISHPFTVARQTELLELKPGKTILEIGTGSGYQTAVLCALNVKVYSIERQKILFEKAKLLFKKLNYSPYATYGDGFKGLPGFAPFDGIIVTCGAPFVPTDLLKQLKVGAKLVIPVNEGDMQQMKVITRTTSTHFEEENHGVFSFVPMLERRERRIY